MTEICEDVCILWRRTGSDADDCGSIKEYEGGDSFEFGRSDGKNKGEDKGEKLLCLCCSGDTSMKSD
jgi:hypothetical protein